MKAIKTRPGLPASWVWSFTLAPAVILFWLPYGILNPYLTIITVICAVSVMYPLTTMLPRSKILFVLGESSILSVDCEIKNKEVTLMELADCGRIKGWVINFYTKWGNEPSLSIPLEQTENGDSLISILPGKMPTATLQTRGLTWATIGEWVLIVCSTLLALGIIRFLLTMFTG